MPILLLFSLGPNTFFSLETVDIKKSRICCYFCSFQETDKYQCRRPAVRYIEMHNRKMQSFLTEKIVIFNRAFSPVVLIEKKEVKQQIYLFVFLESCKHHTLYTILSIFSDLYLKTFYKKISIFLHSFAFLFNFFFNKGRGF